MSLGPIAWAVVAGTLALTSAGHAAADWLSQDGLALATGGVAMGEWLDRTPAAETRTGLAAAASHVERFVGSSVRADVVRLQVAGSTWACGGAWGEVRSSIHRQSAAALAVQVKRRSWRVGVGGDVRVLRFERYAQSRSVRAHAGLAIAVLAGTQVWTHVEAQPLAVRVGLRLRWSPTLRIDVQQERIPGLEPRTRAGVLWGRTLQLGAGFDLLAGAPAGGIGCEAGGWSWSYGTEVHPQLGWSHAWTLIVRP